MTREERVAFVERTEGEPPLTFACEAAGCTWLHCCIGIGQTLVSWELDQTLALAFILETVQRALRQAQVVLLQLGGVFHDKLAEDTCRQREIMLLMPGNAKGTVT